MLDELLEYKEYTNKKILDDLLKENAGKTSTKDLKQNRLKYRNFRNGYSGISRAMKIIAKYFLNKYNQNTDIAINALKAWAGDKYDNLGIKEIDEIAGYVPKLFDYYLKNEMSTINNKKKINNIKKMIKEHNSRLRSFDEDFINKKSKASIAEISDFNKVTYQNIVYNMRNRKLNRYVLVFKKDILDNVLRNNKPLDTKEKDYLLKIIAAYLINVKMNQNSISIVNSDIHNWSLCNHKSYKLNEYKYEDGICPIELDNHDINIKISIDDRLKDNYRVVDINDSDSIKSGEIALVDNGSEDVLKHNVWNQSEI